MRSYTLYTQSINLAIINYLFAYIYTKKFFFIKLYFSLMCKVIVCDQGDRISYKFCRLLPSKKSGAAVDGRDADEKPLIEITDAG